MIAIGELVAMTGIVVRIEVEEGVDWRWGGRGKLEIPTTPDLKVEVGLNKWEVLCP